MSGSDPDYSITLRKYYGPSGYYVGLLAPAFLIVGAVSVYFVIMTQVLYPMCLAIYAWTSGTHPEYYSDPTFQHFSSSYTALVLFVVLIILCSKKDIQIFMKIGSFGVVFVVMLMIFIIVTGI